MNQTQSSPSFLARFLGWVLPSVFVGGLLAMAVLGIVNLCFPGQAQGWHITFIPQWIALSIVIGLPPHLKSIYDPDMSPIGNFLVFVISQALVSAVIALLGLALIFIFDKETFSFLFGHLGIFYISCFLYCSALRIGESIWHWLRSLIL